MSNFGYMGEFKPPVIPGSDKRLNIHVEPGVLYIQVEDRTRCVAAIVGNGPAHLCKLTRSPGLVVCRHHKARNLDAMEWISSGQQAAPVEAKAKALVGKTNPLTVRINHDLDMEFRRAAKTRGLTTSEAFRDAVKGWLANG